MSNDADLHVPALVALGLTRLEAEVYGYLAGRVPATGYQVARGIGRPTANTYKALETLRAKGGVVSGDGEPRLYRAVAPAELLGLLERRFSRDRDRAAEALSRIESPDSDPHVYRIGTREQVIERLTASVGRARGDVLGVVPGHVGPLLRGPLASARARGVRVAVAVEQPLELDGIEEIIAPQGVWNVLHVVVDGRETLSAAFRHDSLRDAAQSTNTDLAKAQGRLLAAEHLYLRLARSLQHGINIDDLDEWLDRALSWRRDDSAP
jgi:sugar-specific transcriptional regulator TrmB